MAPNSRYSNGYGFSMGCEGNENKLLTVREINSNMKIVKK